MPVIGVLINAASFYTSKEKTFSNEKFGGI